MRGRYARGAAGGASCCCGLLSSLYAAFRWEGARILAPYKAKLAPANDVRQQGYKGECRLGGRGQEEPMR
eukprot:3711356-Pleurochrysis_carterae.AAC.7